MTDFLSPGNTVTSEDIAKFDGLWMTEDQRLWYLTLIQNALGVRYDPIIGQPWKNQDWGISDEMAALVRMYELTRAPRYLERLHEFAMKVLSYRDDHRPDRWLERADQLRGWKVMPAWGMVGVDLGLHYSTDMFEAFVYSYPIAAFTRIVAEDPTLYAQYGTDAKAAATQVLETMQAFLPESKTLTGRDGRIERTLIENSGYTLLTAERCKWAYDTTVKYLDDLLKHDHRQEVIQEAQAYKNDLLKMWEACLGNPTLGYEGAPTPHNENATFMMMLIELSRALDSDLFRRDDSQLRVIATIEIPPLLASMHRYYVNRLEVNREGREPFFKWHYTDASGDYENTNHANLLMRCFELLERNRSRLEALLAAAGLNEKIPTQDDSGILLSEGLTNTFLYMIARDVTPGKGGHLAGGVDGQPVSSPWPLDVACEGWLALAEFNGLVYTKCETVILRRWDPSIDNPNNDPNIKQTPWPRLTPSNHAALLALKKFRPLRPVSLPWLSLLLGSAA